MEVRLFKNGLKAEMNAIEADTPLATEEVMLCAADGTPQNKVALQGYVDARITAAQSGQALVYCTGGLPAQPASGNENKVHRVPGTNSYTDYGWDGTQFVFLCTIEGSTFTLETNSNPASLLE